MATATELWRRWSRRDRIKGGVGALGVLVFFSPLVLGYYIDFDELSATQFRLYGLAWLIGSVLPSVLVHWIYQRIERREYEEFMRSKEGRTADRGDGR